MVPNQIAANGDKLDQWILFSIATPEMDPNIEIHNVSTIAVRRDTHTGPGITYITYPVDFSRQKDPQSGQINIVPTMLLAENTSKNCYECHKTGVVPIHPDVEYTFDPGGKLVPKEADIGSIPNRVNALIEYYGPPNFGNMDTEGYGPGIGPYGQLRRTTGPFQSDVYYCQIRGCVSNKVDCLLSIFRFSTYLHIQLICDQLRETLTKQWMVVDDNDSFFFFTHDLLNRSLARCLRLVQSYMSPPFPRASASESPMSRQAFGLDTA